MIGSQAYGLAGEGSDIDRRGIYLPPADLHWSLYGVPDQLENDDTQEAYWEIQKFLVLALKANPNVLECLYTPLVEKATPLAEKLLAMRSIFLSRMVYQTYNGYVLSQFKKMQADLRNQGQVKWKHVMHLIRLLLSGISIMREGFVPVRVEEHREKLLAIRRGRDAVGGSRGLAEASAPRIQRRLGGDEVAGTAGLRAGQCVPDRGPPLGPVGGTAMIHDPRLLRQIEQHPYPLLFVTISGAHLYGFPSPDSDYDLRGVHLLPLTEVVGLKTGQETVEKSGIHDGLEIDLVTHDARKFFGLLLKKNGYVLEQVLSPLVVHTTPEHAELKEIAKNCITRHHAHHYLGFAETQWQLFQKEDPPHVKPLLYVYRVLLTGIHLMRTGEVQANLGRLNENFKLAYIPELIERKSRRHGERAPGKGGPWISSTGVRTAAGRTGAGVSGQQAAGSPERSGGAARLARPHPAPKELKKVHGYGKTTASHCLVCGASE